MVDIMRHNKKIRENIQISIEKYRKYKILKSFYTALLQVFINLF